MKRKRMRGSSVKALSILVAHLSAVAVVLCATVLAMLYAYGVRFYEKPDGKFFDTQWFADRLWYEAMDVKAGLDAKKFFEEGEKEGAVVDIREFSQGEPLTWENTSGLAYSLADLENWSADGVTYHWDEFSGTNRLEELYPPQGAGNIEEAIEQAEGWTLAGAYRCVENALEKVGDLRFRTHLLENYQHGESNLRYLYVDEGTKEIITNAEETDISYSSFEEYLQDIKKREAYVILRSGKKRQAAVETNLSMETENWESLTNTEAADIKNADAGGTEESVYAVWVDESFAAMDSMGLAYRLYSFFAPNGMEILWTGIAGLLLFLLCVIHLTAVAGRRKDRDEICLNALDHMFLEFVALAVFGVWCLNLLAFEAGAYVEVNLLIGLVALVVFILSTVGCFLILWLTFVRRIKGRILWKSTCLCALCGLVGTLWKKVVCIWGRLRDRLHGRDPVLIGMKRIAEGDLQYKIQTERLSGKTKTMAEYVNRIGDGLEAAVEDSLKNERMKTELITNVSHDIKTPLTSIINYVELLKRENIPDEKIQGYIRILDEKAQRLKALAEDVVEASKAATGSIALEMTDLDFGELFHQALGEFGEKFQARELTLMIHEPQEPVKIHGDGRRLWRVLENLFGNAAKYAMPGTRVYAEVNVVNKRMLFSLKNISAQPLNISADELTERFIRGDLSRNTEGSGLGLSIAKSLTELQGGSFKLYLDGDLFKVTVIFPTVP